MSRIARVFSHLGVLLTLFWTGSASQLRSSPTNQRVETCRFCGKLCPISCFVGTCGFDYGFTVRKFEASNKCYSCDPGTSVGIARDGDFMRCSNAESGLPEQTGPSSQTQSTYSQTETVQQGPQGPAVSGDAQHHAELAASNANTAVSAAENAAIHAQKAAEAATARFREITGQSGSSSSSGSGSYQDFSTTDLAEQHQMATQVRAEQSLRTAETAHVTWKAAMSAYNAQLIKLRREQILTDEAENTLQAAEKASEKARSEYNSMQIEAQRAYEQSMSSGGNAASTITAQAAAEELAGTARAAQQRLLIAAKEAKDASAKIQIATGLQPCTAFFLQVPRALGSPPIIGCESITETQQRNQKLASPKITPLVSANRAYPSTVTNAIPQPSSSLDEDGLQPLINEEPSQTLEIPNIEQQMTQNLAERLADNPAAVEDPAVFAAPTVPFTPEQVPIDGTEQIPAFDMSSVQGGMSALQESDSRKFRLRYSK